MTIDEIVKLLEALTKLAGVLASPALVAFVLIRLSPALKDFVGGLSEFSLKGGGIEATAKRKEKATAALVAATLARSDSDASSETAAREAKDAAEIIAESVGPQIIRRAMRARVLWVDDRPSNNISEQEAFAALGLSLELVTSTEEALRMLAHRKFDVILSDMARPPDERAGYTLLEWLRSAGNRTPYFIYSSSNAPEHKAEARAKGAQGSTNRPVELFEYVLGALRHEV